MINSHVILASGWILFCVLHSAFASSRCKNWFQEHMGKQSRFYRLYYTIFALISFAAVIIDLLLVPSYRLFRPNPFTIICGTIVSSIGLMIMAICIGKYFMQLSGLKGLIEEETRNELMVTGIHQFVRHPLYSGTFVFIWGLLITIPSLSLLIVDTIVTVYTVIGLRFEEQKLEKEFGTAYRAYKQTVPMLIPKLG